MCRLPHSIFPFPAIQRKPYAIHARDQPQPSLFSSIIVPFLPLSFHLTSCEKLPNMSSFFLQFRAINCTRPVVFLLWLFCLSVCLSIRPSVKRVHICFCLSAHPSVRLSVCHTRDQRLNGSTYRNAFCTVRQLDVRCALSLRYLNFLFYSPTS